MAGGYTTAAPWWVRQTQPIRGGFCSPAPWLGYKGGTGEPPPPAIINEGGKAPDLRVVNVMVEPLPFEHLHLYSNSKLQAFGDAIAPTAVGSFGFLATGVTDQGVADAIAKIEPIDPLVSEYQELAGYGAGITPIFYAEAVMANDVVQLNVQADAEASIKPIESGSLIAQAYLHAKGIQNLTDDELMLVLRQVRKRRH